MSTHGERRRKVRFENPSGSVPDGDGGYVEGWEPLAPSAMFVKLTPATGGDAERTAAGTVLTMQSFIVEMPYHRGVTTKTRIRYQDADRLRTFQVNSVRDPDEGKRELVLVATELVE